MAALWAVFADRLAEVVVARAAVGDVPVLAGSGWELVFQEVADRIAFEKESLCVLFARYQEKSRKS